MAIHKEQAPSNQLQRTRIVVTEYERGWGSKTMFVVYADSPDEAQAYVKDYNKDNTLDVVPDWYAVARIA